MNKGDLLNSGYGLSSQKDIKKPGLFLVGYFMHGDADHYDTHELELDSVEELEAVISYLKWKETMHHNAEITYRQRTTYEQREDDFYAQAGEKWRKEYLWDGVLDWWPHDITFNDILASLQKYWIIFRDETGEYKVEK